MKINSIPINLYNIEYSLKNNNQRMPLYVSNNDSFVRSNTISFKGELEDQYCEIKKEISDYVLNSKEAELGILESIIQKYSSRTKLDFVENIPKSLQGINVYEALFYEPVILSDEDGKAKIRPKEYNTLYIPHFDTNQDKKTRALNLSHLLHETTHMLQYDDSNRTNFYKILDTYISSHPMSYDEAEEMITGIQSSWELVDAIINNDLNACLHTKMSKVPIVVSGMNSKLSMLLLRNAKMTPVGYAEAVINKIINMANGIDKGLILNVIAMRSKNEKEAYKNQIDAYKEMTGIKGKTNFELKIEIYDILAETAENMKKKL